MAKKKTPELIDIHDGSKYKLSSLEQKFVDLLDAHQMTDGWVREYQFCEGRRWRMDFAHLPTHTGIELDGLVGGRRGGHQSFSGIVNQSDKRNAAVISGWRILVFNQAHFRDPDNIKQVVWAAMCVR